MSEINSLGYQIFFNTDLSALKTFFKNSSYSRVFILTDNQTSALCLPVLTNLLPDLLEYDLIEVDEGEENKNIDYCIGIWRMLIDFEADRNALLINLGGGVVTDMGGFAASTYKRGIDFINIPTTLLSQVDAAVGGKTGIDMAGTKNIIGTFTQPKAVFVEPLFLKTLPAEQLVSGFAEMLKHGLIADKAYWNALKEADPQQLNPELIYRSLEIKNDVVKQDPEEKGLRKILNFGHTIGHAIESFSINSTKKPLFHGEAIAIGMVCEAYLSVKKHQLKQTELEEITDTINKFYKPYPFSVKAFPELIAIMKNDKKNSYGKINCSLLTFIGQCDIDFKLTEDELCESLEYYLSIINV